MDERAEAAGERVAHVPSGYRKARGEDGLTDRERAVLHGVRDGKTNGEIARDLGLTKQRVGQVLKALIERGALIREGDRLYLPLR